MGAAARCSRRLAHQHSRLVKPRVQAVRREREPVLPGERVTVTGALIVVDATRREVKCTVTVMP